MTDEMKRKLNWRAFFFSLTFSVATIYISYMLIFVWRPDWITNSTLSRVAPTVFYASTAMMIYGTIGSLFAKVKE